MERIVYYKQGRNLTFMAEKTTATIGFEKQIWDAACILRGNIDASEYKQVVLGLIFIRRGLKLKNSSDPKEGIHLFFFSIVYLFLLFFSMLI